MSAEPAKRGPGRPPKVKTATERLAALEAQRHDGGGFIIPPPEPLTAQTFRSWLRAVADAGSDGDVEIAWHHCQNSHVKGQLLNEYAALKTEAGSRHAALLVDVERERRAEQAASAKRAEVAAIDRQIAQHRAAIESLQSKRAAL